MSPLPNQARYALTLYAPWAWAVMYGGKDVENRTSGFARHRGGKEVLGRVWIHAGLGPQSKAAFKRECDLVLSLIERTAKETGSARIDGDMFRALRGHVLGSVEVTGYIWPDEPCESPWRSDGSMALRLANPVPLACPIPAIGSQGWWEVSDELLGVIAAANFAAV